MNLNHLFKLKNQIFVVNPTNLVAVCYNPFSPRGYEFDNLVFKKKLESILKVEVYNVKEGGANE